MFGFSVRQMVAVLGVPETVAREVREVLRSVDGGQGGRWEGDPDGALREVAQMLGADGWPFTGDVAVLWDPETDSDGWSDGPRLRYAQVGDMYDGTVGFDRVTGRWFLGSAGDWCERRPRVSARLRDVL